MNRTEQLVGHFQRALDNGVTKDEIIEMITHLAFYAGWPVVHVGGECRQEKCSKEETKVKLCYFNDFRLGVVKGDQVVDITDAVKDLPHRDTRDLIVGVIEHWDTYKAKVEKAANDGKGVPLSGVRLRAPVPRPGNIDCMAVNYMEDGTLKEKPAINCFHKASTAVIGDGDTMVLPDVPATIFEGEAELALIIGKRACQREGRRLQAYIFGYTCFIDGSARGLPPPGNVFFQMKSRATFAPMGPWMVTADEIADPQKLAIELKNNGVSDAEVQHRRHGASDPAQLSSG